MEIFSVRAEDWKVDGGVSFGVVPKTIWGKYCEADEDNLIKISNRLLLIKNKGKLILIDTGFGNKRDKKYYSYKYFFGKNNLKNNIRKLGFSLEQITDVILTHLHDDHVGGAVEYNKNNELEIVFKNANFWISKQQWFWALNPNKREAAAYFSDNFMPLKNSGRLHLIENEDEYLDDIYFKIYNGHTQGQIIPIINYHNKKIVFMADFVPSVAHIPIPYVAAVDIQPLLSLKEKEKFFNEALKAKYILFFEHDFDNQTCNLKSSDKGIVINKSFLISDL